MECPENNPCKNLAEIPDCNDTQRIDMINRFINKMRRPTSQDYADAARYEFMRLSDERALEVLKAWQHKGRSVGQRSLHLQKLKDGQKNANETKAILIQFYHDLRVDLVNELGEERGGLAARDFENEAKEKAESEYKDRLKTKGYQLKVAAWGGTNLGGKSKRTRMNKRKLTRRNKRKLTRRKI